MSKFKIGDVLGLSPTSKKSTYEVTSTYANGTYDVVHLPSGHRTNSTMAGYVLCSAPVTHLYKMGDIVQWDNYPTQYKVVLVYEEEPHYYDFKSIKENILYEHMFAKTGGNYLVSSGGTQVQAVEPMPEKCKWATSQPLDVEPMYYRIYGVGRPTIHPSTASQHKSIQALVVKRTQSSIRLVPPCNLTGEPINIIGKSVLEDDRWKAEAFLQCMECSK